MSPSLQALPTELKQWIVTLVACQDSAYKARRVSGAVRGKKDAVGMESFGKSLGTVRLLNKEFCELGARFLFLTIPARRSLDPVFRYRICNRYASFIEGIDFDHNTSAEACSLIVTCLARFTNLRTLYFAAATTVEHIFGEDWNDAYMVNPLKPAGAVDPNFAFSALELKAISHRIEHLDLDNGWNGYGAAPFVALFPNLKSLKLNADVMGDFNDDLEGRLATVVKSLQSLEFLEIEGFDNWSESWYSNWPTFQAIKRLKICTALFQTVQWKLVVCLGPHLEELELEFPDFDSDFLEDVPMPSVGIVTFPRLKRLTLLEAPLYDHAALPLLARLSSSPLLTDLHTTITDPQDLPLIFKYFPHLQNIRLHHNSSSRLAIAKAVHHSSILCATKSLKSTVITSARHSSTRFCDLLDGPVPSYAVANQALNFAAVRRALEFGMRRLERAKLDDDLDWGLKAAKVEDLERLRLAWED
ncbi:hypothetical protein P7C70_g1845, partial [Phenoliferia sp. Uapishka_3]